MYSIALGPRCFKWKMLSLSGPNALLFIQLLITFITTFASSPMVSLVTTWVSLEEVCMPSFEVLNCWLNLVASCLDDENEIPWKVIATFSASRFALPSIPLIVLHSLVRSVFGSMVQQKSLHFFPICAHIYSSGWLNSILAVQLRWGLFYGGYSWSLWRPVGMWCDAALSRTVRKISSFWQSVGRERLFRAASTSCLYLSQLA